MSTEKTYTDFGRKIDLIEFKEDNGLKNIAQARTLEEIGQRDIKEADQERQDLITDHINQFLGMSFQNIITDKNLLLTFMQMEQLISEMEQLDSENYQGYKISFSALRFSRNLEVDLMLDLSNHVISLKRGLLLPTLTIFHNTKPETSCKDGETVREVIECFMEVSKQLIEEYGTSEAQYPFVINRANHIISKHENNWIDCGQIPMQKSTARKVAECIANEKFALLGETLTLDML